MWRKQIRTAVLWILYLAAGLRASGQPLKVIDMSVGLPNNSVNCIVQDKRGFMWFGTHDGLCVYDGVSFTVYRHEPDNPYSVNDNFITSLACADNGLWVGTKSGLDFLAFSQSRFYRCHRQSPDSKQAPINGFIKSIITTGTTIVVLSAGHGMYISAQNKPFYSMDFNLAGNSWDVIAAYKGDDILAHNRSGLYILNVKTQKIRRKALYNSDQPADNIYYSANLDRIYVGFGIKNQSKVFADSPEGLTEAAEKGLPDLKGVLDYSLTNRRQPETLFATDGNGLITVSHEITRRLGPWNSSLSSDAISALYADRENNLWIATYRGGVNLYSQRSNWFRTMTRENSRLPYNVITGITRGADGRLILGTDGGGYCTVDTRTDNIKAYSTANSLIPGNNVLSVIRDDNFLWMAIYGVGLVRYQPSTDSYMSYALPGTGESGPYRNRAWVLKDDGEGNIWVGASSGLFCFNKAKSAFTVLQTNIREVSEICISGDHLWVSSNGKGVYKTDKEGTIRKQINNSLHPVLLNNNVRYVYEGRDGIVWFGVEHNGLCKYDPKQNRITAYGSDTEFEHLTIVGILEDNAHNLWLSTYNGLFRFNLSSGTIVRFGEKDGFASPQFSFNACYKSDSLFYFGTTKGLLIFNPEKIRFSHQFKDVFFTGFSILNSRDTNLFRLSDKGSVIHLPYHANFFSISFSIPELISPDKIRYACFLENFEKEWSKAGTRRQVTYTNVPPGTYYFRVKSTNPDGQWNKKDYRLTIIISPPWWKTTWAVAAFYVLGIGVFLVAFSLYRHDLKMKHMVELKEIEGKTEKSLNEAKLAFLTDISHELRTPVFLIKAPLEVLIESKSKEISVSRNNLLAIYRSASRLQKLINRIIDYRKLETGNLRLDLQKQNVVLFCRDLLADYEQLCSRKKILLFFYPEKTEIFLTFDPEKLESIISNLITNAYKYTPENGKIILRISEQPDRVLFTVEDNGIGIDKAHFDAIFNQFYQVNQDNPSTNRGDGIGLSFVKMLVEMHGGKVSVESVLNKGSVFSFFIPQKAVLVQDPAPVQDFASPVTVLPAIQDPTLTHTLLVIDDEEDIRLLLEEVFGREYRIIKAVDGAEGLAYALNSVPDLIICDIMMPRMDGNDFLTALRSEQITRHIPVIMLTAKSSEEEMIKAFGNGASAFLPKPVSLRFLRERVTQLLDETVRQEIAMPLMTRKSGNYTLEEKKFLRRCRAILEEHADDTDFGVEVFASCMNMSHSSLYKKLKQITGYSIVEFISVYRVYKAVRLFNNGETNIAEVAARCGFNDPKNFREMFKARMSVLPSQYIDRIHTGASDEVKP